MRRTRYLALGFAILVLVAFILLRTLNPASAAASKPTVLFVGFTNNPVRQMLPFRVETCEGATGLCALFWVTNTSPNIINFKTDSVEIKTGNGWEPFLPTGALWRGVEGSLWFPNYGCFYAVGWPPGLPTNMAPAITAHSSTDSDNTPPSSHPMPVPTLSIPPPKSSLNSHSASSNGETVSASPPRHRLFPSSLNAARTHSCPIAPHHTTATNDAALRSVGGHSTRTINSPDSSSRPDTSIRRRTLLFVPGPAS